MSPGTHTARRTRPRTPPRAAAPLPLDAEPLSPLARLAPVLARTDLTSSPKREEFLAVHDAPVIGKDGIEFAGHLWWSSDLRRLTSVPPASKGKRPTLELRYDAAARSRDSLDEILLLLRDADGVVRQRVRCRPRRDAQQTAHRDEERAAQQGYERELRERRAAYERQAAVALTGHGADGVIETIAHARRQQGRPGELRRTRAPKQEKRDTPDIPGTRAKSAQRTPTATTRTARQRRAAATAATSPAVPSPATSKWAQFNALIAAQSRARAARHTPSDDETGETSGA